MRQSRSTRPQRWGLRSGKPQQSRTSWRASASFWGARQTPRNGPVTARGPGQDLTEIVKSFLQSHEFSRRRLLEPTEFGQPVLADVNGVEVPVYPDDIDVGAAVLRNSYEPHNRALRARGQARHAGARCRCQLWLLHLFAARLVGSAGRVFAVEPNARNIRLLEYGRRANGFDNITIVPMAAGATAGMAAFARRAHERHDGRAVGRCRRQASATFVGRMPLDALAEKIDFIKIDVEGQEFNALRGFVAGLELRPRIVSEFAPSMLHNATGEDYWGLLLTRGYRIGVIAPDGSVASFHRNRRQS